MNLKKLTTLLFAGVTAATPFATNAQNPTILQGNYISNVFGQANFVLNPNAQTNIANVAVTNAQRTRSTTTPLVATTEFNVTVTSANGTITWATRSFDEGMKNQNCEARFSYRGFQATSKAQIKQGANVVAELTLTPSATDPRIASINFPCGDLSAATTFVITDSATLSGTNEIGGIYVGLATNMANVAQAEFVGSLAWPGQSANDTRVGTSWAAFQTVGAIDPTATGNVTSPNRAPRVTIPSMTAGHYKIQFTGAFATFSSAVDVVCHFRITDGTSTYGKEQTIRSIGAISGNQGVWTPVLTFDFEYTGPTTSKTIQLETKATAASANCRTEIWVDQGMQISVYRFPSSSELVVTPETQNVWGVIQGNGNDSVTASSTYVTPGFFTITSTKGKCEADSTNMACKIAYLPAGSYRVTATVPYLVQNTTGQSACHVQIADNKGSGDLTTQQIVTGFASNAANSGVNVSRTFTYASAQTNVVFSFQHKKVLGNACGVYTSSSDRYFEITVQPLDNNSNSALYVQGPVKAAETGAAIPAGYVGEFSTRSISDTGLRKQLTPAGLTFYYPWTGTLTLPSGNWMLCYKILAEVYQNTSSSSSYIRSHVQNQTDSTEVMRNAFLPPFVPGTSQTYLWSNMAQCKPIAITSSKTFRVGISWGTNSGSPTVNDISIRGDLSASELYAIRIN